MPQIRRTLPGIGMALGLSLAAATCAFAEPAAVVPKAPEKSRYQALLAHSPFSLATAPAPVAVAQGSFASNWYVSGIGRIRGADFVSIKSRDLSTQFSLYGGEKARAGEVALVSVTWSDVVGKSTVILRKGTETAKLEFNEAELHGPPQGSPGSPTPGRATAGNVPRLGPAGAAPMPAIARPPGAPAGIAAMPIPRRRVAPIRPPQ